MLNMIDTQDKLKNFSEEQLIREMQMPSGSAPQFMVLSEIERRKRMRSDAQRQEGLMQPTVAQEAVSAAGVPQQGIAQVAQSLAPKTDMTQNTGVPNVQASKLPGQPNQPQRMADGGIMRLAPGGQMSGGTLSAIAFLKTNYPAIYEEYKDDPEALSNYAEIFVREAKNPKMTRLEELEAPSTSFKTSNFRNKVAGGLKTYLQERRDAKNFGEDYDIDQRRQSMNILRNLPKTDPLFSEGSVVERIDNVPSSPNRKTVDLTKVDSDSKSLDFLNRIGNPLDIYRGVGSLNNGQPPESELTGLEQLEAPRNKVPNQRFVRGTYEDPLISAYLTRRQRKRDAEEFGEDYDMEQRRQTQRNLNEYGENDPIFAEGSVVETAPNVSANAFADGTAVTNAQRKEAIRAEELRRAQGQSMPNSYTPLSERAAEQAKRAYLAGGDYNESDVPAIVDMLNRGREFQQSDTYTPPEQIYTDLGANSPLAGLKYEMDGASEDEQAQTFAQYADRLSIERGIAEDLKEKQAIAEAENARRIAGDAMDEDVAMEQSLEKRGLFDRFVDGVGRSQDPSIEFNKMLTEKREAEEAAEAANIASTLDNENRLQKRQLTGLETVTAAQKLKDEAAAKKIIEATGDNDKGKQTFKSTAENMNQDKWLALAQAGLTLMSTGDFGKAGSAGLAALRESKKNDLAERKIAADERLTDARIAAANKKTSGIKAPAAAALSFYQKQIDSAQIALDDAKTTADKIAARDKLTKAQNALRQLVDRYELSMGIFGTGGSSSGIDEYDLTSKAG